MDTIPQAPALGGGPQAGAVPQGSPASPGQPSILDYLQQQRKTIDDQLTRLTKNGAVPTSAVAGSVSPQLQMNPVQPFQAPANQPHEELVGRKANKQANIAATLVGAAGAIGQFENYENQKKQRVLAVDLERTMQATQGIQQAKDVLQTDPNNKDAQATLSKNQNILNAMFSDPKKRKQIAKALDVNFTNPDENKTPEHDALKQATKSYAQQFQDQIPSGMQVNPQAMQQIQQLQANRTSIDKMITSVVPSEIRAASAASTEATRAQTALDVAKVKAKADFIKTGAEIEGRYNTAMAVAKTKEAGDDARQQRSFAHGFAMLDHRENLIKNRTLTPGQQNTFNIQQLKIASTNRATAQKAIDNIRFQLGNKAITENQKAQLNRSLDDWTKNLNKANDSVNKYTQKGGTGGTSNESAKPATTTTGAASTIGKTEDSDDDENSDPYGIGSDDNN